MIKAAFYSRPLGVKSRYKPRTYNLFGRRVVEIHYGRRFAILSRR